MRFCSSPAIYLSSQDPCQRNDIEKMTIPSVVLLQVKTFYPFSFPTVFLVTQLALWSSNHQLERSLASRVPPLLVMPASLLLEKTIPESWSSCKMQTPAKRRKYKTLLTMWSYFNKELS